MGHANVEECRRFALSSARNRFPRVSDRAIPSLDVVERERDYSRRFRLTFLILSLTRTSNEHADNRFSVIPKTASCGFPCDRYRLHRKTALTLRNEFHRFWN